MSLENYPLDWINRTPSRQFTRLEIPEGEGIHTGGVFLSPVGEVWKPLDALPYQNAQTRVSTREAEILELMAGEPGFPGNWRVETVDERRYLVRPFCQVWGQSFPTEGITLEQMLTIEQAIRALNRRLWEVHDKITVAVDPSSQEPFILDLSAAHPYGNEKSPRMFKADDSAMMMQLMGNLGFNSVVELRRKAQDLTLEEEWIGRYLPESYCHVYLYDRRSYRLCIKREMGEMVERDGESWLVSQEELSPGIVEKNGLTWGWSPLH